MLEADPKRDRKARGTAQLSVGDVLAGVVVGLTSYGLFVDVGVADGLVHRSEITWERVSIQPQSVGWGIPCRSS